MTSSLKKRKPFFLIIFNFTSFSSLLFQSSSRLFLGHHPLCYFQELLKREVNRNRGSIPFIYVVLVGVIGIILGYLLKRT